MVIAAIYLTERKKKHSKRTHYPHLMRLLTDIRCNRFTWWRHQMETFSALLAICAGNSPVPGEFPSQRPVTQSFDVFFDLRLNKRLSKKSWGWWFETPSCPLWRHSNEKIAFRIFATTLQWRQNERDCVSIAYSIVCSGTDQRKHQSSASLAFVRGIHHWTVNSPHKGPLTREMVPFHDVIMQVHCRSRIWYGS